MRRRVLGIAFVLLLAAGLGAAVLQYRKVFTPVAWVTLDAGRTGLNLDEGAEVKLRGVVVGEVRSVTSAGSGARVRLALDPVLTRQIPADVTVRLLPRTLFGERYVDLVPPPGSTAGPIRDGAVIGPDRSSTAVELERVLDRTLPLLRAIQPDKLAATLAVLATALEGRGEQLGGNLTRLDAYLARLNEEMPTIAADVRALVTVLDAYDAALPDLLSLLRDVTVTARTVGDQRDRLAAFLAETTSAADTGTGFLDRHGDQIVHLGAVSRPVLDLLAAYAPEYPCLMEGVVALQPRVEQAFSGGRMHITLEVTRDGGEYETGRDEPVYGAGGGPNCRGLPDPRVPAGQTAVDNGYDYGGARPPELPLQVGTPAPATDRPATDQPAMGQAGTGQEQALLKPLVGALTGTLPAEVPDLAVLLWGPLLRGAVVNAK